MVEGFEASLLNVQKNYEESKKSADALRANYEEMIRTSEEQHDEDMIGLQMDHLSIEEQKKTQVFA